MAVTISRNTGISPVTALGTSMTDADWTACLSRNKEHLQIMLAKDYWTTEDLTPLQQAAGA